MGFIERIPRKPDPNDSILQIRNIRKGFTIRIVGHGKYKVSILLLFTKSGQILPWGNCLCSLIS